MPDYSKMTNEELYKAAKEKPLSKGLDTLSNEELFRRAQGEIKENPSVYKAWVDSLYKTSTEDGKQYVKPFKNAFEIGLDYAAPIVSPLLEFSNKYGGAP